MTSKIPILLAATGRRYDKIASALLSRGMGVIRFVRADELTYESVAAIMPRYVFFPHWSWKIPPEIFENFECVIFHMTDLPYGRGGSPLQNLIVRGHRETRLTALRCVAELDAGPIYLQRPLSLLGTAEEIFLRAADQMADMVMEIVETTPTPVPQVGEATVFKRRRPEDSDLQGLTGLDQVHDFIRMLDADGYPPAFLETEHLRFEFSRASLRPDEVFADVRIVRKKP